MLAKLKRLFLSAGRIQDTLASIEKQLERIEDKISRLEGGQESAGFLTRESLLKERHLDLNKLSLEERFDYIYRHRLWASGTSMCSGPGSYGDWAEWFVGLATEVIGKEKIRTITDLGCGDFNVGKELCNLVDEYHALDISKEIIRRNREEFRDLTKVTFQQADACRDVLPRADLVIIRQVLQHLTNARIEDILKNVEKTGFTYALVAEHQPNTGKPIQYNQDLLSTADGTRIEHGSAVSIDKPPFSRPALPIASFPSDRGSLAVFFWKVTPLDKRTAPSSASVNAG